MNVGRLKHGITVLQGLIEREVNDGPEQVDMNAWGSQDRCGTIACIGGWFTLDPVFQAQGLEFEAPDDLAPHYGHRQGMEALMFFFEIDQHQVSHIFGSHNSDQLEHAIERIQNVLDGTPQELFAQIRQGQRVQQEYLIEQREGSYHGHDEYPHDHP
jgi:hypothetical protein